MSYLAIEYLENTGRITRKEPPAKRGEPSDYREDENGFHIVSWKFNEPQPTPEELAIIQLSPEFEAYMFARPTVEQREQAKKGLDEQQRLFAKVLLKEINNLREYNRNFKQAVAQATSLADLKVRVAALNGMADRTIEQLKNAIDNEV